MAVVTVRTMPEVNDSQVFAQTLYNLSGTVASLLAMRAPATYVNDTAHTIQHPTCFLPQPVSTFCQMKSDVTTPSDCLPPAIPAALSCPSYGQQGLT